MLRPRTDRPQVPPEHFHRRGIQFDDPLRIGLRTRDVNLAIDDPYRAADAQLPLVEPQVAALQAEGLTAAHASEDHQVPKGDKRMAFAPLQE